MTKTRKAHKHDFIQHHHLLMRMELVSCPERKDIPQVKRMVTDILKSLNMHSLAPPRVYYLDKPENNRGMTCIAPIKTSHIAFHFWSNPDHTVFQNKDSRCLLEFDIYTCGSMAPSSVKHILHQLAPFQPTRADIDIFNRRTGLKLEHHFTWDRSKRPEWDNWLESKAFLNTRRNIKRQQGRTRRQRGGDAAFDVTYIANNNAVVIPPGGPILVTREQTAERPGVVFAKDAKRAYVIAMYDQDAPDPARLHWLIVFWLGVGRIQWQIETLLDYEPPNPPPGETHTYTIQLLSKKFDEDEDIVQVMPDQTHFNIEEFIQNEGFDRGQKRTFRVGPA